MEDTSLEQLSRAELAQLLARSTRSSLQWHKAMAECERRAQRWSVVMHYAWLGILGCMLFFALATFLH